MSWIINMKKLLSILLFMPLLATAATWPNYYVTNPIPTLSPQALATNNAWSGSNNFGSSVRLASTNNWVTHYSANAQGPLVKFRKARGTEGSPTVVLTEDSLGDLDWWGYTSTGFWPSARIRNKAVSVPTDDHVTSQLRFYVGSTLTPSFLTNIFTLAGGDPSPFAELAAPLILTTSPDGAQTFVVQNSGWPAPNNGIVGSTAGGGISFYQGGLVRMNIGSGGLAVTRASSGTMATFNSGGGILTLGVDGSGDAYSGTTGNSAVWFMANNAERWRIQATGHFIPAANVTYDIGTATVSVRTNYNGTVVATNFVGNGAGLTNLLGASLATSLRSIDGDVSLIVTNGTLAMTNAGAADQGVVISSDGRLGIGTAETSEASLEILTPVGATGFKIEMPGDADAFLIVNSAALVNGSGGFSFKQYDDGAISMQYGDNEGTPKTTIRFETNGVASTPGQFEAEEYTTTSTDVGTFSSTSAWTNTQECDITVYCSATIGPVLKKADAATVHDFGTSAGTQRTVRLHPDWYLTGTGVAGSWHK